MHEVRFVEVAGNGEAFENSLTADAGREAKQHLLPSPGQPCSGSKRSSLLTFKPNDSSSRSERAMEERHLPLEQEFLEMLPQALG